MSTCGAYEFRKRRFCDTDCPGDDSFRTLRIRREPTGYRIGFGKGILSFFVAMIETGTIFLNANLVRGTPHPGPGRQAPRR